MKLIGHLNGGGRVQDAKNVGQIMGVQGPPGRDGGGGTAAQLLQSIDGIKMDDPKIPKVSYLVPVLEALNDANWLKDADYVPVVGSDKPPVARKLSYAFLRNLLTDYILEVNLPLNNKTIDLDTNTVVGSVEDFDRIIAPEKARFGVRVEVPTSNAGELGQWAADDDAFWVYTTMGWKSVDFPTGQSAVHADPEIVNLEDEDEFPVAQDADGYAEKKITWGNIKKVIATWYNDVSVVLTQKTIAFDENYISGSADDYNYSLTDPNTDFAFRVPVPADPSDLGKLGQWAADPNYLWVYQIGGWTKLAWNSQEYTDQKIQDLADRLELEWQEDISDSADALRDELGLQISNLGYTVADVRADFEDADSNIRIEMNTKLDLAVAGLVHGVAVNGIVDAPNPADEDGTVYLVTAAPTGAFAGYALMLASKIDGNWVFQSPVPQETHLNNADNAVWTWSGGDWVKVAQSAGADQLQDILEAAEDYTDLELQTLNNDLIQQLQDAHDDLRRLVFDHALPAGDLVPSTTPYDPAVLVPIKQELQGLKLADATLLSDVQKKIDAAVSGLSHDVAVAGILDTPPPITPDDVVYIVGTTPTGPFAGHANQVAVKVSGVWSFSNPAAKETHLNEVDGTLWTWNGTAWVKVTATAVASNNVTGSKAGTPASLVLWTGTKAQYDALTVKDPATVYILLAAAPVTTPGGTLVSGTGVDGGTP